MRRSSSSPTGTRTRTRDRCRCASHPTREFEEGIDFIAPTRVRARDVARLTRYLVRGKGQLEAEDVLTGHDLDRIAVRCDVPLPLQADGEDLGDVDEAVFEVTRDAISVLV